MAALSSTRRCNGLSTAVFRDRDFDARLAGLVLDCCKFFSDLVFMLPPY
jgi:hypothetical protein